jgi:MYXO-CTERM domain-containing protein
MGAPLRSRLAAWKEEAAREQRGLVYGGIVALAYGVGRAATSAPGDRVMGYAYALTGLALVVASLRGRRRRPPTP